MNKDNIFTMASVHDVPVDPGMMVDLETAEDVVEVRRLIRALIRECYGWPVEDEKHLYSSKTQKKSNPHDRQSDKLKLPKGLNTRSKT